ncbi:unnamed protein product [Kuraishia capsulata CBS 1993]|uniref:NADH:ubiquinone oxidoreductase intermediate-associated protein 30 domain-containing protein n=1 Tax=Kuraishia capsulata CBS 1993 TaxID=1382522 RepID=W6MXT8_9ASCO|nr:uncharacterized protein KUCA_T00005448001 [Kuraishia capsulata CBS 1993]CDK29460.1 unnamed protein product [Kuraishia capsulata CBS 1993]
MTSRGFLSGIKSLFTVPEFKESLTLLDFANAYDIQKVITRCDQELGGYSTVNMDVARDTKPNGERTACAHFHGNLSLNLPKTRPDVSQSGWAMWRTKNKNNYQHKIAYISDRFANFWWDFGPYQAMVLRLKTDTPHRKFLLNVQTDTMSRTDLFQHRLFLNTPGKWETVILPIDDFVLTNRGFIQKQYQGEMEKDRIKSVGMGILDKQYGYYSLYIESIKVMTGNALAEAIQLAREENIGVERYKPEIAEKESKNETSPLPST